MLEPCTREGVAVPEPPRATGKMPVVPPSMGRPVALVSPTIVFWPMAICILIEAGQEQIRSG